MATKYLQSDQSLSTATWYDAASGGSITTAPGDGDTIDLNGYVLTMDQNRFPASGTLNLITTTAKNGRMTLELNTVGDCSIHSASITGNVNNSAYCLIMVTGTGTSATLTINGNLTGGSVTASDALRINTSGNVTIIGNVSAGSGGSCKGIDTDRYNTLTVNGNVTGGSNTNCYGMFIDNAGTTNINGNVSGGTSASSLGIYHNDSSNTLTIVGNVTGGSGSAAHGVYNRVNANVNITGDVIGSATSSGNGINHYGSGILTIIGNVYGGGVANAYAVYVYKGSTVNITGDVIGGTNSGTGANTTPGIYMYSSSPVISIEGNITGGAGYLCPAIYSNSSASITLSISNGIIQDSDGEYNSPAVFIKGAANFTITNCTIKNRKYSAINGVLPTTTESDFVIEFPIDAVAKKFGIVPAASDLKLGVVCGNVVGTLNVEGGPEIPANFLKPTFIRG